MRNRPVSLGLLVAITLAFALALARGATGSDAALLCRLGPLLERRRGGAWLLSLLLLAALASGVGILLKHQLWPAPGVSVGASGGLFAMLAAALGLVFQPPRAARRTRIAPPGKALPEKSGDAYLASTISPVSTVPSLRIRETPPSQTRMSEK